MSEYSFENRYIIHRKQQKWSPD